MELTGETINRAMDVLKINGIPIYSCECGKKFYFFYVIDKNSTIPDRCECGRKIGKVAN